MNFDHILHRANGTLVELNSQVGTFRAVTSEKFTAVRQDVSSAELTLISSEAFTVNVGDWIQAKGIRLYCMSTIDKYTCSEDNNREYQLTFYSPEYYLRLAIFYNTSESESGGVYSYSRVDNTYPSVGTFEDFVKLCCYNCNSVQGERLFKVGTINEDIATDIRVITFSDYNCLAVLKQSCESFETTWKVRVNEDPEPDSVFIIDFGAAIDDFPVTLKVEHAQGLTSIDVTASDKDVYTQFVVKGGSENLPSDYPYPNLQLDEDSGSTPPILANSMIKLPDLYSRWGKSIKELTYEDIKPSRTGTVTSTSENILKFTDSDLIGADWSPVGGTVHFVSGHLIGFTFNCQDFNSTTGEITIESTEENNGFVLPSPTDSYYRINELDKYNIAGVSLPSSYITDAKAVLKERALLGIDYWSQPRMQYAITIDPKIISVEIVPNMGFHIEHPALGIDKVIKVQQVIYDLSKESPYDIESILISDLKTDDSRADAIHRQIATTAHRLDETDKTANSIKTVIRNLDTYIDGAFADGLVSEAEAKAIEKYINVVNSQKSDIDAQFTALYANSYLSGTAKTNLNSAKAALNTATTNLLNSINTAIADGAASEAEKADVDSKFTSLNSALAAYRTREEEAKILIESATASDLDDAIQVGGRNLLLNSKTGFNFNGSDYQSNTSVSYFVNSDGHKEITITSNNVVGGASDRQYRYFFLQSLLAEFPKQGEYYIYSFEYKTNCDAPTVWLDIRTPVDGKVVTLQNTNGLWKRGSLVCKWDSVTTQSDVPTIINLMQVGEGLYFSVRKFKFEKGNKATDWTPAPEDVDADATTKADAAQAAAEATASGLTNTAKNALAAAAGYSSYDDMVAKPDLTVNGLLNSQIINVDDLFANTAFISKLLLEDGFIEYLTVKFLETVGDANGYKVQIENSLNSGATGAESYVRLVNSDGTRKAELVFDSNNVYGDSGGLPVLRITDNGCYSRVFSEGLEAVSTTSGKFSYNMISQYTPFGMVFVTGTHASAAVKGGFTWNKDKGKVLIYVNTLPRGGSGTVSEGFLYRSPDGLNNDVIRYQS